MALRIIAFATGCLVYAHRFERIDLVAVSQRFETTWDLLEEIRVPAIFLEEF